MNIIIVDVVSADYGNVEIKLYGNIKSLGLPYYGQYFSLNSSFHFFAQTSILYYLSASRNTSLLFLGSPSLINITNFSKSCS
jgi:hypothetical protein